MSLSYAVIEQKQDDEGDVGAAETKYIGPNIRKAKQVFDGIVQGFSDVNVRLETWRDGARVDNLTKTKFLEAIEDEEEEDEEDYEEEEEEEEYDDFDDEEEEEDFDDEDY
jgi:hypothetical protein